MKQLTEEERQAVIVHPAVQMFVSVVTFLIKLVMAILLVTVGSMIAVAMIAKSIGNQK